MIFVGYLDGMPEAQKRFTKGLILFLIAIALGSGIWFSMAQNQYSTGQFELGKNSIVEGQLQFDPVPSIRIFANEEQAVLQTIPLVSAGKFGALKLLLAYQKQLAEANLKLDNAWVKLEGALIYDDGKALMELSDLENAMISFKRMNEIQINKIAANNFDAKPIEKTLRGEIVDPKCYFGAMNPGFGKVHRSCAIMCIRGGIPPVLHVRDESGGNSYYLLRDQNGKAINQRILDWVAIPVEISGMVSTKDDWSVLAFNVEEGISRVER